MALRGSSLTLTQHRSTNGGITGCTTQQNAAFQVKNLLYLNDGIQLIYRSDNHFMLDTNLKGKNKSLNNYKRWNSWPFFFFKCLGHTDQLLTTSKHNVR